MTFESFEAAVTYFQASMAHICHLEAQKTEALKKYKDETRAYFGVADGDQANLLQLVSVMLKVKAG